MIEIERITEQVLEEKFDSLPEKLKIALVSESNLAMANEVCKNHQILDEERVIIVRQIVAFALLGFIHTYDVAKEINEALELNDLALANTIADELSAKIFKALLTELNTVYVPATLGNELRANKGVEKSEVILRGVGPTIVEEIKPIQQSPGESLEKSAQTPPMPRGSGIYAPGWSQAKSPQPAPPPSTPYKPLPTFDVIRGKPSDGFDKLTTGTPSFDSTKDKQGKPPTQQIPLPSKTENMKAPSWAGKAPLPPPPWKNSGPQEVALSFSEIQFKKEPPPTREKPLENISPNPQIKPKQTAQAVSQAPHDQEQLPTIIHEEPKSSSPRPSTFSFTPPVPRLSDAPPATNPIPPQTAVFEFGKKGVASAPPQPPKKNEDLPVPKTTPKVVHYVESQIPPTPPPAPVPKPPSPPQPQK